MIETGAPKCEKSIDQVVCCGPARDVDQQVDAYLVHEALRIGPDRDGRRFRATHLLQILVGDGRGDPELGVLLPGLGDHRLQAGRHGVAGAAYAVDRLRSERGHGTALLLKHRQRRERVAAGQIRRGRLLNWRLYPVATAGQLREARAVDARVKQIPLTSTSFSSTDPLGLAMRRSNATALVSKLISPVPSTVMFFPGSEVCPTRSGPPCARPASARRNEPRTRRVRSSAPGPGWSWIRTTR